MGKSYFNLRRGVVVGFLTLMFLNRWVVGALDSAWRAVYSYLLYTDPGKLDMFYSLWGKNAEWFEPEPGTGKHSNISLFERYLASSHKA